MGTGKNKRRRNSLLSDLSSSSSHVTIYESNTEAIDKRNTEIMNESNKEIANESNKDIANESNKGIVNGFSDYRNWDDLPEEILTSILTLTSVADIASAASVSPLWNSAAATAFNNDWAPQHPPLILTPLLTEDSIESRFPSTTFKPYWALQHGCHLVSLELGPASKPFYRPVLSSQTLANTLFVGRNFSKLILVKKDFIILHDVFSGEQITSPRITGLMGLHIDFGTLTAPLHSSSLSLVLLVAHHIGSSNSFVFSWEPYGSGDRDDKCEVLGIKIVSIALFKGHVYFLGRTKSVGVIKFEPKLSWVLLTDIIMKELPIFAKSRTLNQNLVECDGELLMVLFVHNPNLSMLHKCKVEVYKLGLEEKKWVKKEKLNNWCLFIDAVGYTGFSCKDPERWGGRSNCVYAHRSSGCEVYCICPLDEEIDVYKNETPLSWLKSESSKWLSPLWIYPNINSL